MENAIGWRQHEDREYLRFGRLQLQLLPVLFRRGGRIRLVEELHGYRRVVLLYVASDRSIIYP